METSVLSATALDAVYPLPCFFSTSKYRGIQSVATYGKHRSGKVICKLRVIRRPKYLHVLYLLPKMYNAQNSTFIVMSTCGSTSYFVTLPPPTAKPSNDELTRSQSFVPVKPQTGNLAISISIRFQFDFTWCSDFCDCFSGTDHRFFPSFLQASQGCCMFFADPVLFRPTRRHF